MSLAATSRRGAALNWRLAVNGSPSGSRFGESLSWRRAFSVSTRKFPMELNYTKEEIAFRDQVREFVRTHLPGEVSRKVLEHRRLGQGDYVRWPKNLFG